jgi:hypothetical protein
MTESWIEDAMREAQTAGHWVGLQEAVVLCEKLAESEAAMARLYNQLNMPGHANQKRHQAAYRIASFLALQLRRQRDGLPYPTPRRKTA